MRAIQAETKKPRYERPIDKKEAWKCISKTQSEILNTLNTLDLLFIVIIENE